MKYLLTCLIFLSSPLFANKIVNIYAWGGEIPKHVIQQFERETGISVNFSTYDSNETMYAKLRSSKQSIYDVVLPSTYFVERMRKKGMLSQINHNKLSNLKNIEINFTHNDYDKGNHYSVPLVWGATGIFYNKKYIKHPPKAWKSLWEPQWREQLMFPDDSREVFALALLSLHYPPNDQNPAHIQEAYQKLRLLIPNIKLFGSDGVQAVIIDEDAIAGSAWNGDVLKAHAENPNIKFVYPADGFVIWIDCLAIPINPPHPNEAYQFINYILNAKTAAKIAMIEGHAITNGEGKKLLPSRIRNNTMVYPTDDIMKRAHVQHDVGEATIALYSQHWQNLKLAF